MKTTDGERIGPYILGPEIGRGAAGIVRSATSADLAGPLAVKILRDDLLDDEESIARFQRENHLFGSVAHPNVVKVHDLVVDSDRVDSDRVGIVMELVQGGDLRSLMQAETVAPTQAVGIVRKIADGLAHIHTAGVLHRDLKPANVLISGPPDDRTVKITDFGISTLVGETETYDERSLGSPLYMAPEATGPGAVGTASDVYSLGVLLFEMLTGEAPFQAENILALVLAHSQRPVPELTGVPTELSELVAEMLEKAPADRPKLDDIITRLRALAPLVDDEMLPAVSSPLPGRVAPTRRIMAAQGLPWETDAGSPKIARASFATMATDIFAETRARHPFALSAVAAVLILLAGVALFVRGQPGEEPTEDARTLFEPELRNDVLLITRDWAIDVDGALVSTTLLTNIGTAALDTEHLEVLPPGLAENAEDRIEFTIPPASFDGDGSIATFDLIGIDVRQTVAIGYRLPLSAEQREVGLSELATRARTEELSALAAMGHTTRPLAYRATSIAPEAFDLVVGAASSTVVLFGEPRDAPGLWLELPSGSVTWRMADDRVATLDARGVLAPVAEGVTTMEAEFDGLIASASVRVHPAEPEVLANADDDYRTGAAVNPGEGATGGSSDGASATFPGGDATIPPAGPTTGGRAEIPSASQQGATTRRKRPVSPTVTIDTPTTIDPASTTTVPLTGSSSTPTTATGTPTTETPSGPTASPTTPVTLPPTVPPTIPTTTTTLPDVGPPTTTAPTTTAPTTTGPVTVTTVETTTTLETTTTETATTTPLTTVTTPGPTVTTTGPTVATTTVATTTPTTDPPVETTTDPVVTAINAVNTPTGPSNPGPTLS